MSPIIARLYADHRNMAELFDLLEQRSRAGGAREASDYALMLDIMRYATHYADLFHHPREDFIFDLLAGRDPSSHELVAAVKLEHVELAQRGKRLFERLWAACEGAEPAAPGLDAECEAYVAALRRHMAREEEEIFPRAEAILRDGDRAGLERASPEREDPVFGRFVSHEYRVLRDRGRGRND